MGLFGPSKRSRHRRFSYEPRYYDPEREERLSRRMTIMSHSRRRRSPAGLIYFGMLLAFAIWIYQSISA